MRFYARVFQQKMPTGGWRADVYFREDGGSLFVGSTRGSYYGTRDSAIHAAHLIAEEWQASQFVTLDPKGEPPARRHRRWQSVHDALDRSQKAGGNTLELAELRKAVRLLAVAVEEELDG